MSEFPAVAEKFSLKPNHPDTIEMNKYRARANSSSPFLYQISASSQQSQMHVILSSCPRAWQEFYYGGFVFPDGLYQDSDMITRKTHSNARLPWLHNNCLAKGRTRWATTSGPTLTLYVNERLGTCNFPLRHYLLRRRGYRLQDALNASLAIVCALVAS